MKNEETNNSPETNKTLLDRIAGLEQRVERLELLLSFEYLPRTAIVGAEYVAHLFGCSVAAAKRGRCGTLEVKHKAVRLSPLGWVKADVDEIHREFIKTPKELAIEEEKRANARRTRTRRK